MSLVNNPSGGQGGDDGDNRKPFDRKEKTGHFVDEFKLIIYLKRKKTIVRRIPLGVVGGVGDAAGHGGAGASNNNDPGGVEDVTEVVLQGDQGGNAIVVGADNAGGGHIRNVGGWEVNEQAEDTDDVDEKTGWRKWPGAK